MVPTDVFDFAKFLLNFTSIWPKAKEAQFFFFSQSFEIGRRASLTVGKQIDRSDSSPDIHLEIQIVDTRFSVSYLSHERGAKKATSNISFRS